MGRVALGGTVLLGVGLPLPPATFVSGSVLSVSSILLLATFQLHQRNLVEAAAEVPFLALALAVVYLRQPLAQA